eukprot:sb/3464179/
MTDSEDNGEMNQIPENRDQNLFEEWSIDPEREGESSIHRLSDDALLSIFKLLNLKDQFVCGMVCRRWYNLSRSSLQALQYLDATSIHNALNCYTERDKAFSSAIIQVIKFGKENLRNIRFQYGTYESQLNCEIATAIGLCRNLTHLSLANVRFKKSFVRAFSSNPPPALETLVITSNRNNLEEKGLKMMIANLNRLKDLEIDMRNEFITGKCIPVCLKNNPLKSLKLGKIEEFASQSLVLTLQTFCHTLEHLEVSLRFSDTSPLTVIPFMPMMTRLEVNFSNYLDETLFKKLLESMPNLEYLANDSDFCTMLLDDADQLISTVTGTCPKLISLILPDMTCSQLGKIQYLTKLRTLKADGCRPHDRPSGFHYLTKCLSLVDLSLAYTDITDDELAEVIISLENLETLNIIDCDRVTGKFLKDLKNFQRDSPPLVIYCFSHLENLEDKSLPKFISFNLEKKVEYDLDDLYPYFIVDGSGSPDDYGPDDWSD